RRDAAREPSTGKTIPDWGNEQNNILKRIDDRETEYSKAVEVIKNEGIALWNQQTKSWRDQIVARIRSVLAQEKSLNARSKLRVALYAVAAVPEDYPDLTRSLQEAIANFRLETQFRPPGATQIWGLAVNPNPKKPGQVAIGDDNGVIWFW